MAVALLRINVFILLLTSTAALAGEICLDGTCASSLESNAHGKTSLLQQNAVKSSPTAVTESAVETAELKLDDAKLKANQLEALLEEEELKSIKASRSKAASKLYAMKVDATPAEAASASIEQGREDPDIRKQSTPQAPKKAKADRAAMEPGRKDPDTKQLSTPQAPKKVAADFAAMKPGRKDHDIKPLSTPQAPKKAEEDFAGELDAKQLAKTEAAAKVTAEEAAEKEAAQAAADLEAAVAAASKEASDIAAAAVNAAEDLTGTQAKQEGNDLAVSSALIDRSHKLIMGWTPRAACTSAVYMFFVGAGMYTAEDQQRFPWVHDYREALSEWAQPHESDMRDKEFLKFKLVRNPYTRAVSNWVHQMGTNFSYNPEIQALAARHGVSDQSNFLQWLMFIQQVDWHDLDQHSWPQFSRWERAGGRYDMILQLEDSQLQTHLDEINGAYGSSLNFETMHVSLTQGNNNSQPVSPARRSSSHPPFASELFTYVKGSKTPAPEDIYSEFPEAINFVQWVYADDFNAYGYSLDVTRTYGYKP